MKLHKYLLSLYLFLAVIVARAQVSGVVIDSRSRKPLDFVNVYYDGKGVGTMTDEEGKFVIKENPQWNTLTVFTMGYVK